MRPALLLRVLEEAAAASARVLRLQGTLGGLAFLPRPLAEEVGRPCRAASSRWKLRPEVGSRSRGLGGRRPPPRGTHSDEPGSSRLMDRKGVGSE